LPGRYEVDEIRAEPFVSGHTSRSWGRMLRHPDGRVEDEPWPWDEPGSGWSFGPLEHDQHIVASRCIAHEFPPVGA
jgi:hypothetical protein